MVATALDTYSKDPINAFTDSGEKILTAAAQQGRVFVVNDAESVRHPILYDHGQGSYYYSPDQMDGGGAAGSGPLVHDAKEILTHSIFTLQSATRNINMPQSQPPGNLIDYVSTLVRANMMSILNEEEINVTTGKLPGNLPAVGGTVQKRGAMGQDALYTAGVPLSLPGLFGIGTSVTLNAATPNTTDKFGFQQRGDIAKWDPTYVSIGTATSNPTDAQVFGAFQTAVLRASYSELERPTHCYMPLGAFEAFLAKLRASAALPDPVMANMGKEGTISFAGITLDWSRYLLESHEWRFGAAGAPGTNHYPILGLNWNSLRLNTVRAGGIGSDSIGFIRQLGPVQTHPLHTNLFKRIEWKRQWSIDNGRRSFFAIYNWTA
jgi:hypothetical protein